MQLTKQNPAVHGGSIKPKDQQIALAEIAGWKNCGYDKNYGTVYGEPDDDFNRGVDACRKHGHFDARIKPHVLILPTIHDWNWLGVVRQNLNANQKKEYISCRIRLSGAEMTFDYGGITLASAGAFVNISPATDAECILRACGKWSKNEINL
jgi:hypothetical protein